jgi:Cys-rich repeat protein
MRMAWMKKLALVSACVLSVLSVGCQARGVGDPCIPETIPQEGFANEVFVETSSVQCRTRTCLNYRLPGDPRRVVGDLTSCPPGAMGCVDPVARDEQIFCSCRCSAGTGDSSLPLCTCQTGFHCVNLVTQGGDAVRGGYCIPTEFCESSSDCAAGERCSANRCVVTP